MPEKLYPGFIAKITMPHITSWLVKTFVWCGLTCFGKENVNWSAYDHVCTKNTSSMISLSVLQVQWLKCIHVTSLVTTNAIYSENYPHTHSHRYIAVRELQSNKYNLSTTFIIFFAQIGIESICTNTATDEVRISLSFSWSPSLYDRCYSSIWWLTHVWKLIMSLPVALSHLFFLL
jgi:hypothetical protein